jgi:nitrite reductase/ring-hydroxylating ferredoxin subunit
LSAASWTSAGGGGDRGYGVALSTVAYGLAGISSFLGGELVYSRGIGVNHTAWDAPPDEYTVALDADTLQDGKPVRGEAGGVPIVLVKRGTAVFALDATCTHAGGPLDEGTVAGDTISCPWHGSVFCLRDGSTRRGPATEPAICFEARVRDGKVEVRRAGRS